MSLVTQKVSQNGRSFTFECRLRGGVRRAVLSCTGVCILQINAFSISMVRVREIRQSSRTCPAKFSNVRRRGKFLPDKMSGEEIQFSVWMLKMSCEGFLFRPTWNVRRNLKMSGKGPVVRRSKCSAKLKIISRTLHGVINSVSMVLMLDNYVWTGYGYQCINHISIINESYY